MVVGGGFGGVVDLEGGVVDRCGEAEEGLPEAWGGGGVVSLGWEKGGRGRDEGVEGRVHTGGWTDGLVCLAEEGPGHAAVVGVGERDAEEGVDARGGVFVVVAVGDDDAARGELQRVRVVDVVGVGGLCGWIVSWRFGGMDGQGQGASRGSGGRGGRWQMGSGRTYALSGGALE